MTSALVVVGLGMAVAAVPTGNVRYAAPAALLVPIAPAQPIPATRAERDRVARLTLAEPDVGTGPPREVDPDLIETAAEGPLPRVAADGRTPLAHYARPGGAGCKRACVAVVVTGLGLADRLTERALALPAAVALSFSPYGGAAAWQVRARARGHEVLLDLPLEPANPLDDAGPLTVRAGADPAATVAALRRALGQGSGYVAVQAVAGAFASAPASAAPLTAELRARGLALVEAGGAALARPAEASGLPYLATTDPIDAEPTPEAIDRSLAEVAAKALLEGRAVALAGALPASFDRITTWADGLPQLGIDLVPPSRLFLQDEAPALAEQ